MERKTVSRNLALALFVSSLALVLTSTKTRAEDDEGTGGKEETVSDAAYAIDLSVGTIDLYESVGSIDATWDKKRLYIAPKFRFVNVRDDMVAYAPPLRIAGKRQVLMRLDVVLRGCTVLSVTRS